MEGNQDVCVCVCVRSMVTFSLLRIPPLIFVPLCLRENERAGFREQVSLSPSLWHNRTEMRGGIWRKENVTKRKRERLSHTHAERKKEREREKSKGSHINHCLVCYNDSERKRARERERENCRVRRVEEDSSG